MRRRLSPKLGLAGAALALAIGVGVVSVRDAQQQLAAIEACEAVQRGDFDAALALTSDRPPADDTARAAADCRCTALIATDRGEECTELMANVADDASGWVPSPTTAAHLVRSWRDAGRPYAAARLARHAAARHPEDVTLFRLELATRSGVEDEARVLAELAARIPESGEAAARMRVALAQQHLQGGDPRAALDALGPAPPPGTRDAAALWFDTKGTAAAMADDVEAARSAYAAWQEAGGDPAEVRARYALALSIAGLDDPERSTLDRLRDALAERAAASDAKLREALAIRLILTLANADRLGEALAVYDRERERSTLDGLHREELERAALQRSLASKPPEERRGVLHFRVEGAAAGARLLLSPDLDAPLDAGYEPLRLARGRARAERSAGEAPQRWVLRGRDGAVHASGTVSPRSGETLEVRVRPRPGRRAEPVALAAPHPGDGRRRVAVVLLDCADWRIVQYLRTRGELPVLDALLRRGHRAVLDSDPPLTAAALETLVWPDRRGGASFVGAVHRIGVEISGLASVGENPFGWLSWVLPETRDLFEVLGAGEHSAANLLLAHGGIRAGRHGEVTGPNGARRRMRMGRSARDLDPAEREHWPALAAVESERDALNVRQIAAEFDAVRDLLRDTPIDLLMIRIEPLDLLTHAHFAEMVRDGQDDGRGLLPAVYRYIDARLGEVYGALDADDVLVTLSDHGIRTAMEHSRHAIFVAVGAGIPPGRAEGSPALRGVPRVLGDLLGVETDWPRTGVAPASAAWAAPQSSPAKERSRQKG